jgi:acetylornithine deacetylase
MIQQDAIHLLKQLIAIPSLSKEENKSADLIEDFLRSKNVKSHRHLNNVWATNKFFDSAKPTILLNSHHDTVKPNPAYTFDPFSAIEKDGKLFGLGSTDAGGSVVSLIAAFLFFYLEENLKYNLVVAVSAEEEISGQNGIESLLRNEEFLDVVAPGKYHYPFRQVAAIVGEPTQMHMAISEKGLLVLDCSAKGKAGHAARDEGENAIYTALKDIEWLKNYQFPKISDLLGPVKISITSIETENKVHNVVPSACNFIVDLRVNELYTFEEILEIIRSNIKSEIQPRSNRLRSSFIALDHPLVKAGLALGRNYYGSPTTSDKALMNFPALKIGPGDSARSHTADEFIFIEEINMGIELYIQLLKQLI